MTTNQTIDFKDPLWITAWLSIALEKEKKKYKKCPVTPDPRSGARGRAGMGIRRRWLFPRRGVVQGASVSARQASADQAFADNTIRLVRAGRQGILREFYSDYRAAIGGARGRFPVQDSGRLPDESRRRSEQTGRRPCRFVRLAVFPHREQRSAKMPVVSVEFLHEIAYGCIRMVEHANNGNFKPSQYTYSWRLKWKRDRKYSDWRMVRANSDEREDLETGWKSSGGLTIVVVMIFCFSKARWHKPTFRNCRTTSRCRLSTSARRWRLSMLRRGCGALA